MKQTKYNLGLLLLAVLSVTVLAVSPASARHGVGGGTQASTTTVTSQLADDNSDDSTTGVDDSTSSNSGSGKTSDDSTSTTVHGPRGIAQRVNSVHSQAEAELKDLRKGKTEKTVVQRQKLCVNRQKAVDNKITAFGTAADRHLTKLNGVFDKLKAYQTEQKLDAANYQTLVDAATAKQQAASDAVAALKVVTVNIDCTSTDPASSLTVVKTAAKTTRQALQDYRKSLKSIVVAFAQNKTTATTITTTPNTSASTGDN